MTGMSLRWQQIPVVINNRNRLTYMRQQLEWFESIGMERIIILDNASTYEPLLDYYRHCPHTVIRLRRNVGYLAVWETTVHLNLKDSFYIYTDPDIVPDENCPQNVIEIFLDALLKYTDVDKVGFGLKIDDIPAENPMAKSIVDWESQFWQKRRDNLFFEAPIDTTFALYRGHSRGGHWLKALRSDAPYMARHMPWYSWGENLSDEDRYYAAHAQTSTHWTKFF